MVAGMSRLGPWHPTDADARLDRLESLAEIRQLPVRYALALDSRDMDMMVSLFTPDVRVGREASGRAALRGWFVKTLSEPKMSVHFVGNHIVDFDDADHARGIVYCHDELGRPDGGWDEGMLQYWDTYVRVDGPTEEGSNGEVRGGTWSAGSAAGPRRWRRIRPRRPHHQPAPRGVRVVGPVLGRGRVKPVRLIARPRRRACAVPTPEGAAGGTASSGAT
jgi:hypothetical protein